MYTSVARKFELVPPGYRRRGRRRRPFEDAHDFSLLRARANRRVLEDAKDDFDDGFDPEGGTGGGRQESRAESFERAGGDEAPRDSYSDGDRGHGQRGVPTASIDITEESY